MSLGPSVSGPLGTSEDPLRTKRPSQTLSVPPLPPHRLSQTPTHVLFRGRDSGPSTTGATDGAGRRTYRKPLGVMAWKLPADDVKVPSTSIHDRFLTVSPLKSTRRGQREEGLGMWVGTTGNRGP